MHETLEATFRIVTPMFIGGADQSPSDGIRPPSVKGALRFWWRALNWGRFCQNHKDTAEALCELHEEETQLFGNAAQEKNGKQTGGQGQFLLTVQSDKMKCTDKGSVHTKFATHDAARYLGYGLMVPFTSTNRDTNVKKPAGQLDRGCVDEDQRFTVKLLFRDGVDATIQEALIALGLLGGLGSRSRHGMGSLSLESLRKEGESVWPTPTSRDAYIKAIHDLLTGKRTATSPPPYTAFGDQARVDVLLEEDTPYKVLDGFGRGELMYRSWGKNEKVLGQLSEKRFKPDHDWGKNISRPAGFHPQRVVFGLPHNYGKAPLTHVNPEKQNRRASPLLFHVHALDGKTFVGASVLLPATFLPKDEKINAGGTYVPAKIEWNLLTEFLDGKDTAGKLRFPKRAPV